MTERKKLTIEICVQAFLFLMGLGFLTIGLYSGRFFGVFVGVCACVVSLFGIILRFFKIRKETIKEN
ncbi:MAG: hypothetical protein FWD76_03710 [Firmicutes bacterium]|nr:hypothetical protein [Bacillota bacterium]